MVARKGVSKSANMKKCSVILLVEDDDSIREVITMFLESEGYSVKSARNGKEGMEILSTMECPCLIILDLMMPVMDGWEFLKTAKRNSTIASIPIVVTSAVADDLKISGAVKVLKKPIDLDGLMKIVSHYCRPSNPVP